MKVKPILSHEVYRKMMLAPQEKRDDIYRYELMTPFKFKWECIHVPIKAAYPGGYDVVMASSMLGFLPPSQIDETQTRNIELISDPVFWKTCQETIERSLKLFTNVGIRLPVQEYVFSILLADPDSPYTKLNEGYCGDGGIPGYILGALVPNEFTIDRMPAALAHETNHNVRFQFIQWTPGVTLGDMLVSEGLGENFAASLFGEDQIGPWVSKTQMDTLNNLVKPVIKDALDVTSFENITAYLYGDEIAEMQGFFPVGLPYCAGYALGYHLIKYYLQKTGCSIIDATLTPTKEILSECKDFWE